MLVDISSRLPVNEHFLDQLTADKVPEDARMVQILSLYHATPDSSRGYIHRRQASVEPCQAVPEAVADISDVVRAKVTSRMRCVPVLGLAISDKDSGSEEKAVPIHKKRGMKSGKL